MNFLKKLQKLTLTSLKTLYNFPKFIKNSFFEDKDSWPLWMPVLFGLGSIFYIFFPQIFSYKLLFVSLALYIILFWIFRKKSGWLVLLFVAFLLDSGYYLMGNRVERLKTPKLMFNTGKVEVVGKIDELLLYERNDNVYERFIVETQSIRKLKKPFIKVEVRNKKLPYFDETGLMQNAPKKVRINLNDNIQNAKVGDVVKMQAKLIPLPKKPYPTGYDFERYAYFKQIGAIGYQGEVVEILKSAELGFFGKLRNNILNYRNSLAKSISTNLNRPSAGILVSLLTGIKAYIKHDNLENLRTSGLAHLIAVSGLHMFVIVGFIMFITRWLFAKVEYFALNFNVKKWSAICGLIAGFAYLAMVGFPVSARRAYIMISLVLLAVILDKEAYSLRSVAFAGSLLLAFRPELISTVGFQMSFMAVIGLISVFRLLREKGIKLYTTNKWLKPFYYIIGSIIASAVATLCAMPFSIYYFNTFSTYNVLANIIAVPLMVFWVVPLVLCSFVLLPFGFERFLLTPASLGTDLIVKISEKIVSMPNAVHIISSPTKLAMGFIICGMLWFLLWSKQWRWFGIPVIVIGIIMGFFTPKPDLIVDYKDRVFAILDGDNRVYFSRVKNDYKKDIWMKKNGENTVRLISEYPYQGDFNIKKATKGENEKFLQCNEDYCLIKKLNKLTYIVKTPKGIKIACTYGDKVINISSKRIWYCKDMNNVYQREWGKEDVEVFYDL